MTLYRPDRFGTGSPFGYEIDNLLHWQNGTEDRLVIIECKDSPIDIAATRDTIPPENQEWYSRNPDGRKNLKDQLFNQAESIWQNLCVPPTQRRRIDAIVVSSAVRTPQLRCMMFTEQGLTMHVMSEQRLVELLARPDELASVLDAGRGGRLLRIAQSELLRLARQSVVVPELGHPEIDQAMELIRRCRQTLDGRLFDFFDPRDRRWAINGAAGMGKSVLLAYAVTVISTGKALRDVPRERNNRTPMRTELVDHIDERLRLPPVPQRKILVIGLKPRQLEVLRGQWEQFHNRFLQLAGNYLSDVKPQFHRWHPALRLNEYNVICIDEAHDLCPEDQQRIATWWDKDTSRYLIIACDHHQKLRLAGAEHEKWMLNGISFAGCSTRLKRNYRSPTPVYCAALGLMFRWFAPAGQKVVPTKEELEKGFGFNVQNLDRRKGGVVDLAILNDSHPANHWRYTVSRFTYSDAAFAWLSSSKLNPGDVLWVRFGEQDHNAEHDAEDIKKLYNYKDLNSLDSHNTIDAEIKGREFPIVVIEGLPKVVGVANGGSDVWALRRQLYLCASRATAFLFFIFNESDTSPESAAIAAELEAMLQALSSPIDPGSASSKTWAFKFDLPDSPVSMDVFLDEGLDGAGNQAEETDESETRTVVIEAAEAHPAPNARIPTEVAHYAQPSAPAETNGVADISPAHDVRSPRLEPAASEIVLQTTTPTPVPAEQQSEVDEPTVVHHHKQIPRRLHEVAKAIGWEPRELLDHIKKHNPKLQIQSVSWTIDWMTAEALIKNLTGKPRPVDKPNSADSPLPAPRPESAAATPSPHGPPVILTAIQETKPVLLSEKDFQRFYGQIQGWRQIYRDQYLKSGKVPPYLLTLGRSRPLMPAPTPRNPTPIAPAVPLLTVRQIGQYLGLKPFQVIAVLMPHKPNANPNDLLDRKLAEYVCRKYERTYPSRDQVLQLLSIPAPPK